jgi:hypothetical protein
MSKFNLESALHAAEAGDSSLWEDIARHLLQARTKPRAKKSKKSGPQTWAHVTLTDGREFLTSAYTRNTEAETLAAHTSYAQHRARMEDSGDKGGTVPVFLNPTVRPAAVKCAAFLHDPHAVNIIRNRCFTQRGLRHGWLKPEVTRLAA